MGQKKKQKLLEEYFILTSFQHKVKLTWLDNELGQ